MAEIERMEIHSILIATFKYLKILTDMLPLASSFMTHFLQQNKNTDNVTAVPETLENGLDPCADATGRAGSLQ